MDIEEIMYNVRVKKPLVHCFMNYVAINDSANIILAAGGQPIMAMDEAEVEEITANADALVINMGMLRRENIVSMIKAGRKANELGIPIILDPVGIGASAFRKEALHDLFENVHFTVIKGNISEIKVIYDMNIRMQGIDASEAIDSTNILEYINLGYRVNKLTGATIVISGAIDLVVGKSQAYIIKNGCEMMSRITGSGCMLGALIGAYIGANDNYEQAAAIAVALMGYSGECAYSLVQRNHAGTGSFRTYLIDYVSLINAKDLEGGIKIEYQECNGTISGD